MLCMSVAGSFTTQSPGLQFFMSATSRLLIVTAATSDSVAGSLKIPTCVRVGVRSDVAKLRSARTYCSRRAGAVTIPNRATSRRSRVSSTFTTASPRSTVASCVASRPMRCCRNSVSRGGGAACKRSSKGNMRLRLDQRVNGQVREEFHAEGAPKASLRLIGVAAGPLQAPSRAPRDFVRQGRARPVVEESSHFRGEVGALHQHADLGVLLERARIEVDRADEYRRAIEHEGLAV